MKNFFVFKYVSTSAPLMFTVFNSLAANTHCPRLSSTEMLDFSVVAKAKLISRKLRVVIINFFMIFCPFFKFSLLIIFFLV